MAAYLAPDKSGGRLYLAPAVPPVATTVPTPTVVSNLLFLAPAALNGRSYLAPTIPVGAASAPPPVYLATIMNQSTVYASAALSSAAINLTASFT